MTSRYSASLNGVSLSSLDSDLYIHDIGYSVIKRQTTTAQIANRSGSYYAGGRFGENKISITFAIRKYDTADRQEALQKVIAWAINGGWLETGDRPGQHIYVKCSGLPAISSSLRWLDNMAVEFTAYDYPFWTSKTPIWVTLESNDSSTLELDGVYESYVEAEITAGEALTSITIECGDTSITLAELEISANDVITISYTDDHHILEIKTGTTSLLNKRTASSSDDLIAQPGDNTVSFSASGSATCVLSAKEVYI